MNKSFVQTVIEVGEDYYKVEDDDEYDAEEDYAESYDYPDNQIDHENGDQNNFLKKDQDNDDKIVQNEHKEHKATEKTGSPADTESNINLPPPPSAEVSQTWQLNGDHQTSEADMADKRDDDAHVNRRRLHPDKKKKRKKKLEQEDKDADAKRRRRLENEVIVKESPLIMNSAGSVLLISSNNPLLTCLVVVIGLVLNFFRGGASL